MKSNNEIFVIVLIFNNTNFKRLFIRFNKKNVYRKTTNKNMFVNVSSYLSRS